MSLDAEPLYGALIGPFIGALKGTLQALLGSFRKLGVPYLGALIDPTI